MRCPHCHGKLFKQNPTSLELKTKGKHLFTKDGNFSAQCYWCGKPVAIPIISVLNAMNEQKPKETYVVKG